MSKINTGTLIEPSSVELGQTIPCDDYAEETPVSGYFDAQPPAERETIWQKLSEKYAKNSSSWYYYSASHQFHKGDVQAAADAMHNFTRKNPDNPSGWYYYADYLFHNGEIQEAGIAILKAYQLHKYTYRIHEALCQILPAAGKLAELRLIIEEIRELFQGNWKIQMLVAKILVEKFQETELACQVSLEATKLEVNSPEVWLNHGDVLSLAGQLWKAKQAKTRGKVLASKWYGNYKQVCLRMRKAVAIASFLFLIASLALLHSSQVT